MFKFKKKLSLTIFAILCIISTTCLAVTTNSDKAKLEIVENNICTIQINDFATFEKKIVDYNLEKKEITLGLTVTNTAEAVTNAPFEIVLLIDNSLSMKENKVTTDVTRLEAVTNSAKTLASKLLEKENTKVAVVSFSTSTNVEEEGSLKDAMLRAELTSNKDSILSSIEEIATDNAQGPRTDIDAGIQVAKTCFSSENNNKYLILLTDGIPNTAVGGPTSTFSADTATKTKATLQSLEEDNINVISAMIGLNPATVEPSTELTYKYLAEEVFGTMEEPTIGSFYYVSDDDIEDSICNTIFSNIVDVTANTLTNLKIYDYFPQEIIDNFDFEYVTSPNLGTVSNTIDLANRCIIWTIDELAPQTTGYLAYKLTLKKEIDSNIIDVVLDTNEKVDITADELDNDVSSDVTPKVKVTMEKEEPKQPDKTVTQDPIPQTGSTPTLMLFLVSTIVVSFIIGIRYFYLNRNIK